MPQNELSNQLLSLQKEIGVLRRNLKNCEKKRNDLEVEWRALQKYFNRPDMASWRLSKDWRIEQLQEEALEIRRKHNILEEKRKRLKIELIEKSQYKNHPSLVSWRRRKEWRLAQLRVTPEFNCTIKISAIFKYCARQYKEIPLEIEVYNLLPHFLGWDPSPLAFNNATTLINIELSFEAFDRLVNRKGQKYAMGTIRDSGIGQVEVPDAPINRRRLMWELDMTEEAKRRCNFHPKQLKKSGSWLHPSVFETRNRPRIELDFFEYEPDSPGPLASVSGLPPNFTSIDLKSHTANLAIPKGLG